MNKSNIIIPVLVALAAGVYYFFPASDLEKETKPVAVEAVTAISASWDAKELEKRADAGLIKAMSSQGQSPEELMKLYSALGKLNSPPTCKIHSTATMMKAQERNTTVSYECEAEYEKAPAMFALTLRKSESETQWSIYYLNIHSDIFSEIIE